MTPQPDPTVPVRVGCCWTSCTGMGRLDSEWALLCTYISTSKYQYPMYGVHTCCISFSNTHARRSRRRVAGRRSSRSPASLTFHVPRHPLASTRSVSAQRQPSQPDHDALSPSSSPLVCIPYGLCVPRNPWASGGLPGISSRCDILVGP